MNWTDIGYCDCTTHCKRWTWNEKKQIGSFAPYVPKDMGFVDEDQDCRKLHHFRGKNIQMTIIDNEVK